jgi:amino acid adenylation domain-containing protein
VIAPVTAGQQRLWFLAQVDPEAVDYHIPIAYRLRGPLDPEALAAALADVMARQGTLRTRFPLVDGAPVQEVLDDTPVPLEYLDLAQDDPGGDGPDLARAERLVAQRANTPFDLTAAPPWRATLVRLRPDDYVFSVVLHHILADDWSLDVLVTELAQAYAARRAGRAPAWPPLPLQYADYARSTVDKTSDDGPALAYWRDQLAGAEVLDLPTDRPRPPQRTTDGAFAGFQLGPEVAQAVRTLSRLGRATPFMTLMAGYLAVLALHSGARDICVGTPVSGRDRSETEALIGYFLNVVVVRGDLSGNPTFRELLARVKATAVAAFSHRDMPVERLMRELDAHRDPSRTPLFDTMFIVHRASTAERLLRLPDIDAEYFDPGHRAVKVDLTIECVIDPAHSDDLKVVAAYRTDLFEPATIARLVRRFGTLLQLAARSPDAPLSSLFTELATGEQAPVPCGESRRSWPSVLASIADRVCATPDAVALWHGDIRLTYAELDRRARVLATLLRAGGAGPDRLVGLLLPAGADLVVAMLAAWHAGAGYVPLDPDAPPKRLAYQLADCAAPVVVTTDALRGQVPPDRHVVDISTVDWGGPAADTTPGPLAYAIYTSGTTGTPKAVLVPQSALAARVAWMRERYRITAQDHVLQFAAPTFDTFAEEVYPSLTAGATVVVPTGERAALPDFLATPAGQAITVLDLPTSYWHELAADVAAVPWPPGLRLLILGGEQARGDVLGQWFAHHGERVEVINTYGPTETTIVATAARLTPADAAGRPPIGAPIADTCVHLLDEWGGPVPDGVPGELVIGGAGVADGYLNQPELTAARFVSLAGTPHYRTGDRVRRRPDGALEFLGRLDLQLKVRGYRIEAGEVETALTAHPAVRHAVATVDGSGRLVAHIVPEPGTAPSVAELRAHAAELLPPYAQPQAYGFLDTLPLTRHGKVDRAAVAAVPVAGVGTGTRERPRTDAEQLVAAVWAEVLGVDDIGVHDDFFDLGGHSLLATRVAARLRASLDLEVPLRTIFQHTTVAELATAVEELLIAQIEALDDEEVRRQLSGSAR